MPPLEYIRFPGQIPLGLNLDTERVSRLFDADRRPKAGVRQDDWNGSPTFGHLDLMDTVQERRGWYARPLQEGRL